jgi:preprotein translocase subunit YajC
VPLSHHLIAVLAAGSTGSTSTGKSGGSSLTGFLPLILIVVVGYLLLVRPARNRQKRAAENRAAITPGVEVTTTAGLIATVVDVNDEDGTLTLEVAPGVHSRYVKGAIARVNTPLEPEPEAPTGEHEAITDPEPGPTETTAETPPDQQDH